MRKYIAIALSGIVLSTAAYASPDEDDIDLADFVVVDMPPSLPASPTQAEFLAFVNSIESSDEKRLNELLAFFSGPRFSVEALLERGDLDFLEEVLRSAYERTRASSFNPLLYVNLTAGRGAEHVFGEGLRKIDAAKDALFNGGTTAAELAAVEGEISLQLVTYNAYFLPFQNLGRAITTTGVSTLIPLAKNLDTNACERACEMPRKLAPLGDVFVIQEAFDKSAALQLKQGMAEQGVKYATKAFERSLAFSGFRFAGSGLVIMSKYPIVEEDGVFFQDAFKDGDGKESKGLDSFHSDVWADKGILYAKIMKDGFPIHVFTTHTQAKSNHNGKPVGIDIRKAQFQRLKDFIVSKRIPSHEAVLIAGDLNVPLYARPAEYEAMIDALGAALVPVVGYQYTTLHTPLYEAYDEEKLKKGGDQIDYVLYDTAHLKPEVAFATINTKVGCSDHFPVVGDFKFGNARTAITVRNL